MQRLTATRTTLHLAGSSTASRRLQRRALSIIPLPHFLSARPYPVPRISVAYSSQEDNKTTLTILSTELADAGTYTCGSDDPTIRYWTSSIIVGVMGTCTLRLLSGRLKVSRIPARHCERLTKLLFIRYDTRCYFNMRSKADMSQLNLPHGNN